jgi:hypothetical protein
LAARGERNRCLWGWPSTGLFGPDLKPLTLDAEAVALMQAWEASPGSRLGELDLAFTPSERCGIARSLLALRVLLPVA